MATCQSGVNPLECQTFQIIEPDTTLPVGTIIPGLDPSLDEQGSVILSQGQRVVDIIFTTPKAGDYRFEYLYIDALGITNPGFIAPVVMNQNAYLAVIDLAGNPIMDGYILRWHAKVTQIINQAGGVDAPELQYLRLPMANTLAVVFNSPRSNLDYGFSELRVENLSDPPQNAAIVNVQVYQKSLTGFLLGIHPTPPNNNYFLRMRTP